MDIKAPVTLTSPQEAPETPAKATFEQKREWTINLLRIAKQKEIRQDPKLLDIIKQKVNALDESQLQSPDNPYPAGTPDYLSFEDYKQAVARDLAVLDGVTKTTGGNTPEPQQVSVTRHKDTDKGR